MRFELAETLHRYVLYVVAGCADPGFARNWHIEGFYNLRKGAELFGIPAHYIQSAIYKQEIPAIIRNFGRKGRTWVSRSSLEKLQQAYEQKKEAKRTVSAKAEKTESLMKEERLDELFARHPLVKDARCFRLSWWPETEPDCFSSWEEA
ncbi:MAG: hypothetical protein J5798_13890 [Spirochaetaceae bacterium]|nr:hypothetical protein [Spirochaetaceae bacterium]